jgi:hypothetical protein
VRAYPLTWWNKQLVELLSAMTVKVGDALAFAASRLDFAMWTCKPCNGDERNVKDGASMKCDFKIVDAPIEDNHTIKTLQITLEVLTLLQEPLKFSMQGRKLFGEPICN